MTEQPSSERSIFEAATEKGSPAERAAYLDRACGGDEGLRREVEALLAAHDRLGGARPTVTADEPVREGPGTVVGPYRLMEQIGEGGMGLVFVAEQQRPVRRLVALKVIKPGMDTREVVARFEAERQALALMDHPNIARVLDAGATESGRPYFVMELVRGTPITHFCEEHRLAPRERLRLFMDVCQAIQHAHQKGVIHRDVKPSNVLVTLHDGRPVAKVIDFGVAKAVGPRLTERTVYTRFAQMIGSPLYMSPEQAEMSGLDVDTRADIYSLGVLLYELLTGTTPFDKQRLREAPFDEMRRIIREEEPPTPSTRLSTLAATATEAPARRGGDPKRLSRFVRGDLDWVVMKALAKDRNRRYATAKELADDVERFLDDRPVQARPPTLGDRLRKWARRHRAVVRTGSAVLALSVVALAVGALVLGAKNVALAKANESERAQRRRADANLAAARKAVDEFFVKVTENPKLRAADFHALRKDLLASALPFYEEFVKQQQDDPELELERARAHGRLGVIRQTMGEAREAMANYEQAQAIFRRLADAHPDNPKYRRLLARSYHSVGSLYLQAGRFDEAEKALRPGVERQKALAKDFPAEPGFLSDLIDGSNNLAYALYGGGRPKEGEQVLRDALGYSRQLAASFPAVAGYRQGLATCLNNLGNLLSQGRPGEAEGFYRENTKVMKSLADQFPDEPEYRQELARSHHNLGELLRITGRPQEAEPLYREALKLFGRLANDLPKVPAYRHELAMNHFDLGRALAATRRPQEAEAEYRQAISIYQPLTRAHPAAAEYRSELAETLADLALLRRDAGELPEARKLLEEALSLQQAAVKARPKNPQYAEYLSEHYARLGDVLLRCNDHAAAGQAAEKLAGVRPKSPADAYAAAGLLARCAGLAGQDQALPGPKRRDLAQGYGDRAVLLLREAIKRGYKDLGRLKQDKDLAPLRTRQDFRQLLAEQGAKSKG